MDEITAVEAADLLREDPDEFLLLDVREYPELEAMSVNDAMHIPMGEIPARLAEIDRAKVIICMCHAGGRSAQVAAFLQAQGYTRVVNLAGGIAAWSDDVK